MADKIVSIPAAARTFAALRDLGYDLNSAVADILDNSFSKSKGNADNIYIWFDDDPNNRFRIRIFDDGRGMSEERLEEAMRLGSSADEYEKGDLSKYGMGMKTASLSQANKLTVISRSSKGNLSAYQWDMNHVKKTDKWELFKLPFDEIKHKLNALSIERKGGNEQSFLSLLSRESFTAVLWDDLFEFQKNFDSYKSLVTATNFYYRKSDNLALYLRLIFHRFLTGENIDRKRRIYFNGDKLEALDPFCRHEEHTKLLELSQKNGSFVIDSNLPPIIIKRYILPTNPKKPGKSKFSSIDSWEEAKGVLSWNEAQGYYVYRNNRLINFGGWYRTKALDEHDKLARASIDLTEEHDELFTLDIKRTRIQFPEAFRNHLVDNINKGFIAAAKSRYAASEKKQNEVKNSVRNNTKTVSYLSSTMANDDNISVTTLNEKNQILISNTNGKRITNDTTYKTLTAGQKIISASFKDDKYFWKMVPNPNSEFQVLINKNHPFYDVVYGNPEKDKKITAIMDAFLFTMSFVELKCITNNNELLFEQMKEVASQVLRKIVDEKIV